MTVPRIQHRTTDAEARGMPAILYGTAWKKERTTELVKQALREGFRGIDTACQPKHYDEAAVGRAIREALDGGLQRSELYIQTKFTSLSGQDPLRVPYDTAAPIEEQVEQSCNASIEHLGAPLDAIILHSPLPQQAETLRAWRALEACVQRGAVRALGLSNCYQLPVLEQIFSRASIKPSVLQNRFHAETGHDAELRAFCAEQGVVYQSFWTLTANRHILENATLQAIAKRYRVTPAQAFFRCLTQLSIVPLTGTTSVEHMQQDLAIFDFAASPPELQAVQRLLGP